MNVIHIYDMREVFTAAVSELPTTVNNVDDSHKEEVVAEIAKLFPPESTIKEVSGDKDRFVSVIEHPASTKEAFDDWLKYHSLQSGVTYRIKKTTKKPTVVYCAIYGCNRCNKSSPLHTACKATLRVNIKRVLTESGEFTLPAVIKVDYRHNHEITRDTNESGSEDPNNDTDLRETVTKLFPSNTKIVSAVRTGSENEFTCILKVPSRTKQEFMVWLDEHSTLSCITYRLKNTSNKGKWLYNAYFRCHHNTKPRKDAKKPHEKHTNCNASLHVIIKDKDISEMCPTVVTLVHKHNHRIMSAAALVYRDPSPQIKEKFNLLFRNGVEPSRALHLHHMALKEEFADEYFHAISDRRVCPDKQWVYRLYYSLFNPKRGPNHFDETVENLRKLMFHLNCVDGESFSDISVIEESKDIIYAICTPFMKRVHSLGSAGEIVYVDCSGNFDKLKFRTFSLLCDTSVGGLPLGVFVTTSESDSAIISALEMLKKMLPEHAFGGKGELGPSVFMIDNSAALERSLQNTFAHSIVLYSSFHLLQTSWRWIFNGDHKIPFKDRRCLMNRVSDLVHICNPEVLQDRYCSLLNDPVVKKYPHFIKYLEELYTSHEKWAHIYLRDFNGEDDRMEILVESAVRVLNDRVFKRTTTSCLVELFEFASVGLSNYYTRKVLDAIGGCKDRYPQSKYLARFPTYGLLVVKISELVFEIRSSKNESKFTVDMELGLCECPTGSFGVPCEHQQAARKMCMVTYNALPGIEYSREEFNYLAVGPTAEDVEWNGTLRYAETSANDNRVVVESVKHSKLETQIIPSDSDNVCDVEDTLMATTNRLFQGIKPLFCQQSSDLLTAWVNFTEEALKFKTAPELTSFLNNFTLSKGLSPTSYRARVQLNKNSVARKSLHICGKKCDISNRTTEFPYPDHENYTLKISKS